MWTGQPPAYILVRHRTKEPNERRAAGNEFTRRYHMFQGQNNFNASKKGRVMNSLHSGGVHTCCMYVYMSYQ